MVNKIKLLLRPIYLINRETGHVDVKIVNQKQYDYYYKWFLKQNDVKSAIKVFCDVCEQSQEEFLKDFNLIELVNCLSNNYIAKRR